MGNAEAFSKQLLRFRMDLRWSVHSNSLSGLFGDRPQAEISNLFRLSFSVQVSAGVQNAQADTIVGALASCCPHHHYPHKPAAHTTSREKRGQPGSSWTVVDFVTVKAPKSHKDQQGSAPRR